MLKETVNKEGGRGGLASLNRFSGASVQRVDPSGDPAAGP